MEERVAKEGSQVKVRGRDGLWHVERVYGPEIKPTRQRARFHRLSLVKE